MLIKYDKAAYRQYAAIFQANTANTFDIKSEYLPSGSKCK
jgi:hypothetical protein